MEGAFHREINVSAKLGLSIILLVFCIFFFFIIVYFLDFMGTSDGLFHYDPYERAVEKEWQ